ncbi:MAG: hypothetical protein ACK2UO_11520 [Caldilineaceae bacterium]
MPDDKKEMVRTLAALRSAPDEQAAYAANLLVVKNGLQVVQAALSVLAKNPYPPARASLRDLYWHYAEHNGTRDPAAYTRAGILKALQPIMGMDDTELVVDAVTTYEFLPPSFQEEAGLLRGTAIVLLAELDRRLASFFATRLLADGYTESMSGEPALTAARVLAACGELLPLYFYATQQQGAGHPEVTAECLRNLGDAPEVVIDELVAQFTDSEDRAALVGLFDLLVMGQDEPRHAGFLDGFLRRTKDIDLYNYLVTIMVTSPNEGVQNVLAGAVKNERSPEKIAVLRDALAIAPPGSQITSRLSNFV